MNKLKGMTLLETIVYIGLFSIVLVMAVSFMLTTQESNLKSQRRNTIHKSSEFVIQHLDDRFENVLGITNTSVFNTDNGILDLQFDSGTKQYTLVNSTLYFDGVPITPSTVLVSKFYLEPVYQGNVDVVGVRVNIVFVSRSDSDITQEINMLFSIR